MIDRAMRMAGAHAVEFAAIVDRVVAATGRRHEDVAEAIILYARTQPAVSFVRCAYQYEREIAQARHSPQ